jgi:hypothetical protein
MKGEARREKGEEQGRVERTCENLVASGEGPFL